MNRGWMLKKLEEFESVLDDYLSSSFGRQDEVRALLHRQWPTVNKIITAVSPALADEFRSFDHYSGTREVQQAIGIIQDWEAVELNLAPESPVLVADRFHEYVWAAAAPLWPTGQYRVAVQQAAIVLSARIRIKADSALADRSLVQTVFSINDPTPTQSRLHFPKAGVSETTWRSQQDGLLLMAQGAFAGIRNVATHTDDEWTEQIALEQLAILSVVARWADKTVLVKAAPELLAAPEATKAEP